MSSIATAMGMKWSYLNGLVDRATNKTISKDPDKIVQTLLPGYVGNVNDLHIDDILDYVYSTYKDHPKKIEALIADGFNTLQQHYNVTLPTPNENQVNENDSDVYFLAKLRDRIVDQDMIPLVEDKATLVEASARINHIEDLVMFEGPKGLLKSIEILRQFANGSAHNDTTLKFDGSPAVAFGRDETGQFIFTDKSGFSAKGYNGKATSAKALGQMFTNRKPPMDDARKQFIGNMMSVFNEYEKATPANFRGIMKGDLLYFTTPPITNGTYTIKPNIVQYDINPKSKIGQRVGQSTTGVVVHEYIGNQYNSTEQAISQIQGNNVFVIPPVFVQHAAKIDTKPIDKLDAYAKKHNTQFAQLFNPANLKGMSDLPNLFYSYINAKVDTGLEDLGSDFTEWLSTKKLTDRKRANVTAYVQEHAKTISALFTTIRGIMKLKDYLVSQFDNQATDVKQSINGKSGGEGYVLNHKDGLVKLVPRSTFSAANRAAH